MDKKYITFYDKFIRHSKTVSDRGVIWNSALIDTKLVYGAHSCLLSFVFTPAI